MRLIVLLSLAALCAGLPVQAQVAAPQRQAGESEMDWRLRLYRFTAAPEIRMDEMQRRLELLSPADRALVRHHGTSIVSAYIRCERREPGSCEEWARLTGRPLVTPQVAAASARPAAPAMTAEQQDALAVWNELYPGLNSRRPDPDPRVWLRYTPAERASMVDQCIRLRRAADILGPNYTRLQPCPPLSHFEGAAEQVRNAEIAETERINAARAAAARAASASSGSGLVEVRTYDQNGNFTGTRMMTPSQAQTVGARPQ